MIVGAALVELHVHGSRSLKQKRGVVRSVVQRVRDRFHLAVSEVGGQNTWQRAVLGIAAVGNDAEEVRKILNRAVGFIEGTRMLNLSRCPITRAMRSGTGKCRIRRSEELCREGPSESQSCSERRFRAYCTRR